MVCSNNNCIVVCACKSRKGNLPPQNNEDQPAPKSLLRLLKFGGQVTSRKKAVSQNNQTVVPSQKAPHKIVKSSKTDHKCEPESSVTSETREASPPVPPQGRAAMFVRRPGESTRNYLERIDVESKFRIADCLRKERKKSNKRKMFVLTLIVCVIDCFGPNKIFGGTKKEIEVSEATQSGFI